MLRSCAVPTIAAARAMMARRILRDEPVIDPANPFLAVPNNWDGATSLHCFGFVRGIDITESSKAT